jgi:hypothetical protein
MDFNNVSERSLVTSAESPQLPELFEKWLSNHLSAGTRSTYAGSLREFSQFLSGRNVQLAHPDPFFVNYFEIGPG